jgi:hypothetical protein
MLAFVSVCAAAGHSRAAAPGAPGPHAVAGVPGATDAARERAATPPRPLAPTTTVAPKMRERWYGWQSLSTDGASLLLLVAAGAASDSKGKASDIMAYGAVGGYLLGGPATHLLHDSPSRGAGSLGLRLGLPIAFGFIGSSLERCSEDFDLCGVPGAIVGGVLGIATAVVLDASVLGYDEVPLDTGGVRTVGIAFGRDYSALVAAGTF